MHTSVGNLWVAGALIIAATAGAARSIEASSVGEARVVEISDVQPSGDLTLEDAVSLALRLNPSLAAADSALSASEARITEAGVYPNPKLELEIENFGGTGDLRGFDSAESTALVSQPILLGGKRGHRRAVAESDHTLAGRDLEAVRLDVVARTTRAFYSVLIAQHRERLMGDLLGVAERLASTVQARVDAGKVSPVEATRARIEVARARVGRARAEREVEAARARLAATWGSDTAMFDRAVGELPDPTPPPPAGRLRSLMAQTPEVGRLEEQVERQRRVLELEESLRVPNLEVTVGPRRLEESGESTWVAGVSLPLPIFDRNQGARRAAAFEVDRARRNAEAFRVSLEAELAAVAERLAAVAQEAIAFEREVVPAASEAFQATETGYREGKFGFLDVLDGERALFEARSDLLDSLEEYAAIRTELERLIGRPLPTPQGRSTPGHDASQGDRR